jgi:tRNA threonylcarbamoyladenosine biosynthesis protein TsaB
MRLIALETATDVCSVALLEGNQAIHLTLDRPRAHAEQLVPMIGDVLSYAGLRPTDLDAVAVSMGPGSYTGLRIGVSTAKGLVRAVGCALVGVPTLDALAAPAALLAAPGDTVCAVLHARRDEVYAAVYEVGAGHEPVPLNAAAAVHTADLAAWLPAERRGSLWLSGPAAECLRAALGDAATVRILPPPLCAPSARWTGRLGLERLKDGAQEDPTTFEPFYLKPFVAKQSRSVFEKLPF